MPSTDRVGTARHELLALRGPSGGWGYRRGSPACAEPTALAGLALLASAPAGPETRDALRPAALWLGSIQNADGSVGVSEATPSPGWSTPYALLLWKALGVLDGRARAAAGWLLNQKGRTIARADDPGKVIGHDATLVGWPWVVDTHSWLEPTAAAVLALGRAGSGGHPRVAEGLALIRDRVIDSGGWNYGNRSVFGRPLRPQPAPTGLALLALAGTEPRSPRIDRAVGYLEEALPGVRASASLGWGLVGLRAWGESPAGASAWLSESLDRVAGRSDAAPKLACLLLAAAGGPTLELFGRAGPCAGKDPR